MANKFRTYFGQIITNTELNGMFDALFTAVDRFVQDFGYAGIAAGASVTQHTPNNLTVDVGAPTIVYDQEANRMEFGSPVVVNMAVDENGAPTAVTLAARDKWLSIFIEFVSTPTDPRTDDLGNTVYFQDVSSYQMNVVQGSEASTGTATRPTLRGDQILLADVKISFGTTTIVNAAISATRSQVIYEVTGSPFSVRAKSLTDVLQAMADSINTTATDLASDLSDGLALTAKLAVQNVFTERQKIEINDVETALLWSEKTWADGGNGLNAWKLIMSFRAGPAWYNFYTGQNFGDLIGAAILTINSAWNSTTQKWALDDGSKPAAALILYNGRIRFSAQVASAAAWSDWPGDKGDTYTGGEFKYPTTKFRKTQIVQLDAILDGYTRDYGDDVIISHNPNDRAYYPVRLATGATLTGITVIHFQSTATADTFDVYKRSGGNFTVGSAVEPTRSGIVTHVAPASSGLKATYFDASWSVDNEIDQVFLRVNAGDTGNYISAVRMHWSDHGPRND